MKYRGWIDGVILTMEEVLQLLALIKKVCRSTMQDIRGAYKTLVSELFTNAFLRILDVSNSVADYREMGAICMRK